MMTTCDACRYWSRSTSAFDQIGRCERATDGLPTGGRLDSFGPTAGAFVFTGPKFGCVLASEVGKPRAAPTGLQRSISPQNSETSDSAPRVKP